MLTINIKYFEKYSQNDSPSKGVMLVDNFSSSLEGTLILSSTNDILLESGLLVSARSNFLF
jgi:hypothetical protein